MKSFKEGGGVVIFDTSAWGLKHRSMIGVRDVIYEWSLVDKVSEISVLFPQSINPEMFFNYA